MQLKNNLTTHLPTPTFQHQVAICMASNSSGAFTTGAVGLISPTSVGSGGASVSGASVTTSSNCSSWARGVVCFSHQETIEMKVFS